MKPVPIDPAAAWLSATTACGILIIATLLQFITFPAPHGSLLTGVRLFQIGWSCLFVALLLPRGRATNRYLSLAAYSLVWLPQLLVVWVIGAAHEATGRGWEPFLRQKIIMILVAVLSPGELRISATLICAFAVEALLEYRVGGLNASPAVREGEPWTTLLFAAASLAMLGRRVWHLGHEIALRQQLRRALFAEEVAHLALAVRDLTNTPLQTLRASVALLRARHDSPDLTDRMERALSRIGELNCVLGGHEADVRWTPRTESFDPVAVLDSPPKAPEPP